MPQQELKSRGHSLGAYSNWKHRDTKGHWYSIISLKAFRRLYFLAISYAFLGLSWIYVWVSGPYFPNPALSFEEYNIIPIAMAISPLSFNPQNHII